MGRRKYAHSKNLAKKARYQAIELARLMKCLGITDVNKPAEIMQNIEEIANVKSKQDLKKDKNLPTEDQEMKCELNESQEKESKIEVKNEKTEKVHIYNAKTLKDQHGNYPPWFKRNKIPKRLRKKAHAQQKNFKQQWTTTIVPLNTPRRFVDMLLDVNTI